METNTAGQNFTQAVEDGFHRRLLDEGGGHIEQGSIPTMGGRNAYAIFRHVHQTSTDRFNREPQRLCQPEEFMLTKDAFGRHGSLRRPDGCSLWAYECFQGVQIPVPEGHVAALAEFRWECPLPHAGKALLGSQTCDPCAGCVRELPGQPGRDSRGSARPRRVAHGKRRRIDCADFSQHAAEIRKIFADSSPKELRAFEAKLKKIGNRRRESEDRNNGKLSSRGGLIAIDEQGEGTRLLARPRMWVLRRRGGCRAELARHRVDVVIASIERHGASAFHGGDGLYNAKFFWPIYVRDGDGPVAPTTRSKGQAGLRIEPVGVYTLADGHCARNLVLAVVPELHQAIVAADDKQAVRGVNRLTGRIFAWCQRPALHDLQGGSINFAQFTFIFDIYVDVTLAVSLRSFWFAVKRNAAENRTAYRVDRSSVVALSSVESEHPFSGRFKENVVGVALWDSYLAHNLERIRIENRHRTASPVTGEGSMKVGGESNGMRFIVLANVHFPDNFAGRVSHHHIRPTSDEQPVRYRISCEVVPAPFSTKHHFLDQLILWCARILRARFQRY